MDLEEFDEMVLLLAAADAFHVEDLAEVGVVLVCDVNQVGLYEGFGGRGVDLDGLEEGFYFGEARVHALYETCWSWGWEERRKAGFKGVRVEQHLNGAYVLASVQQNLIFWIITRLLCPRL